MLNCTTVDGIKYYRRWSVEVKWRSLISQCEGSLDVAIAGLESAPVPTTRDTGSNLAGLAWGVRRLLTSVGQRGIHRARTSGTLVVFVLRVDLVLDLVEAVGTSFIPTLVSAPAEIASPRENTFWVKSCFLVERNHVRSMGGAKDVTAMAAVMATEEETKGGTTSGRVTASGG